MRTVLVILLALFMAGAARAQPTECRSAGESALAVFYNTPPPSGAAPTTHGVNGMPLALGDSIFVIGPDGKCVGSRPYLPDSNFVVPMFGADDMVAGLEDGQQISFVLYNASNGSYSDATFSLQECGPFGVCADTAAYAPNAVFHLASLHVAQPIPVEVTEFLAHVDGSRATITWSVASETGNAGFRVERLRGAWREIAFVEGRGTASSSKTYSVDVSGVRGPTKFRLVQVDLDGEETIHGPIEVLGDRSLYVSSAYPNPSYSAVHLDIYSRTRANVVLYNALGQRVASASVLGETTVRFDASGLASGRYFVVVRDIVRKITIVK